MLKLKFFHEFHFLVFHDSTSLGVPVVLVSDVNNLPARNTVAEVYKRIVTDLTEAESIIATDYTRSDVTDATAVASKSAVQALLSRVYLYMGIYRLHSILKMEI